MDELYVTDATREEEMREPAPVNGSTYVSAVEGFRFGPPGRALSELDPAAAGRALSAPRPSSR
jgi:hypothetical protein